jgi:hypothetical protein
MRRAKGIFPRTVDSPALHYTAYEIPDHAISRALWLKVFEYIFVFC